MFDILMLNLVGFSVILGLDFSFVLTEFLLSKICTRVCSIQLIYCSVLIFSTKQGRLTMVRLGGSPIVIIVIFIV